MGTRGYIVHRYKRRWLVVYNHWNSYPGCLGVSVLLDIPTDPDEFQAWLIDARGMVETRAKEWEAMTDEEREHCFDDFIALEQPVNDVSIEWAYEMDLDNLVFHIDGCPLFPLDHMPSEDIFLKSISIDNYGDRASILRTSIGTIGKSHHRVWMILYSQHMNTIIQQSCRSTNCYRSDKSYLTGTQFASASLRPVLAPSSLSVGLGCYDRWRVFRITIAYPMRSRNWRSP
ncbi:hypothetical protein AcW1_003858 [Taiwanofungus camphoratus]|nr:hypothetical protein AcW1_003858 [Antrodia cinnamomea]